MTYLTELSLPTRTTDLFNSNNDLCSVHAGIKAKKKKKKEKKKTTSD